MHFATQKLKHEIRRLLHEASIVWCETRIPECGTFWGTKIPDCVVDLKTHSGIRDCLVGWSPVFGTKPSRQGPDS